MSGGASSGDDRAAYVLRLFREFTIRNSTQWEPGCGHHHPIWAMVADVIGESAEIVSGPEYRFIYPGNTQSLADLTAQGMAARSGETGAGSTEGNSPVGSADAPESASP